MFIAAKGTHENEPCVYIDLYRVQDEKIVEHWGFPEMVPPQEQWKNNNGMCRGEPGSLLSACNQESPGSDPRLARIKLGLQQKLYRRCEAFPIVVSSSPKF